MKPVLFAIVLAGTLPVALAQDALSLYHWEAIPKRLMLNPAAPVSHRAWLSLPVIGHAGLVAEMPWSANDVVDLRGRSLREVVAGGTGLRVDDIGLEVPNIIDGLGRVGEARVTSRVNLFGAGVRTAAGLFSINLDQQVDAIASMGPTPVQGLYFGEAFVLQRGVEAAGIGYDGTVRMTLALGFQRRLRDTPWRLGGNLKLARTQAHARLIDMTASVERDSAGAAVVTFAGRQEIGGWSDEYEGRAMTDGLSVDRLLAGGNFGLGVDLGAYYEASDRLALSASVTDIGFQRLRARAGEYGFRNRLRVGESRPLAQRERVTLADAEEESSELSKNGRDSLTNRDPYTRPLPAAVYLGGQYRFLGEHSVGLVVRNTLRDGRLQTAAALSFNLRPWPFLEANTSLSYSSVGGVGVGVGLSARLAIVQVYAGTDNVVAVVDPEGARRASAVAGVVLLLPEKRNDGIGRMGAGRRGGARKPVRCYRF